MNLPGFMSYSGVSQQTDEDAMYEGDEFAKDLSAQQTSDKLPLKNKGGVLWFILHLVLLSTSAGLFLQANLKCHPNAIEAGARGSRSTIGNLVNEYHPLKFHFGSPATPYKGPPSPAVDDAWAKLTENKFMVVPDEHLHGHIYFSRQPIRASNGNDSGLLAKFEGFHALHCVNLLRKHTWLDYYVKEQAEFERDPNAYIDHLDHCADLLRQMVQCNMDLSILTYYRAREHTIMPDFNTLHQCQNFDTPMQYVEDHRWEQDYSRNGKKPAS